MEYFKILSIGFVLSFIGVLLAVKLFPKIKLLDFPQRYGLTRNRLPYPGGIILGLLFLGLLLLDPRFLILGLPLLLLGGLSFWDDRKTLPAKFRLFCHFLIAILVYFLGIKIEFIGNPFAQTNFELSQQFPILAFLLTIFWIVSIQNAMNWFDGLSGLAPGVSAIGFFVLGLLGLLRPELLFDPTHHTITLANFYLTGICLGGFYFFWTKKIVLGDSGSQLLGFLLAVMAIFSGAKIATTLLVLALPILDFFIVILRRIIIDRKSPFQGDLNHLHHNLARKLSEKWATLFLLLVSFLFGGIAVFLVGTQKLIALLFATVFVLGLTIRTSKSEL
ncbi:undecaprenyl/decaprenyl-phosphate alpha-N-acetylglucosaminyl 1-phosphate transferase [Candidatus Gracilibacteria bacterium]|nr:undecaprenyl/decaprenyl-phosphate alpha-N-acetylglucosaminyl 1-phosphate transferase [Candidatus Gracilibacteria bacterium]